VTTVDIEISPKPWSPPREMLPTVLPDLHRVPLGKFTATEKAALNETLNRVLPSPEIQPVPVAAFNSSI
jgi:FXSXX-COOH protein